MRHQQRFAPRIATLALGLASVCWPRTTRAEPEEPATQGSDTASGDSPADSPPSTLADRGGITGQWFWMQGKAMPGVELSLGRGLLEVDLEVSFVTLTESSPDFDGSLLGNQLGLYVMLTPLRGRYYDVSVGLGGDFYLLWAIHSDAREGAFAPRVVTRFWPLENLALTFTARSHLLHGDRMQLGTARDGSSGPPILLSTGISWGFH